MRKSIFLGMLACVLSLQLSAQKFSLPDIKGGYYFYGDDLKKITSEVSDLKKLILVTDQNDLREVEILRVADKYTVVDIVTYFVDVLVTEPDSLQPKRMEMVLVENLSNNRIRMELETGEEWIRPPSIPSP